MVQVVVAQYQTVQSVDAECAQGRREDTVTAIGLAGKIRPAVVKHGVTMCLHCDRQTLSDIKHDDACCIFSRRCPGNQEHWQQQNDPQPAQRKTARCQYPCCAQHPQHNT